jgi:hypothetical protein
MYKLMIRLARLAHHFQNGLGHTAIRVHQFPLMMWNVSDKTDCLQITL